MINLKKLNAEKKLGIIAFLLGAAALFAGNPYNGSESTINIKELALTTVNENDIIEPAQLADWIIQKNAGFTLVDLRDESEYVKYFIPGAMNIEMINLTTAGLLRNQKIILYSDGDLRASQAWFMLKSNGYKGVYLLNGGLTKWKNEILFPKINPNASVDQLKQYDKLVEVSKFFGGSPQTGTGNEIKEQVVMPEIKLPAQINLTTPKKKKREGC